MPIDPLELLIKVIDDQARERLRAFAAEARKTVNDINNAQQAANNQQEAANRQRWNEAVAEQRRHQQAGQRRRDDAKRWIEEEVQAFRTGEQTKARVQRETRGSMEADARNYIRNRKREIDDLNETIKIKGQDAARSNSTVWSQTTKDRQRELADLRNAIIARYKEEEEGSSRASKGVYSLGQAWLGLRATVHVAEMMRGVVRSIADELARARDHMKEWSERMERSREGAVELARILGVKPTGQFVAQQASEAARMGMRPSEWQGFQRTFHDEVGGAIIPPDQDQGMSARDMRASGYVVNQAEAQKFLKMAAPYATRVEGLTQEQSAKLAAAVTRLAPAGATADQMFDQFAKMARLARRARGGTSQMVEAMGVVASEHALNADENGDWGRMMEYGALTSVEAERNPAQAVTSVRAFERWRRQLRQNQDKERRKTGTSRMAALGITPDMSPKAVIEQLSRKKDEFIARGGTEDQFWDKYGGGYQFAFTSVQTAGRRADIMGRVLREAQGVSGAQASRETQAALADIHQPGHQIAEESRVEAAGLRQAIQDDYLRSYERRAMEYLIGTGQLRQTDTVVEAGRLQLRAGLGFGSPEQQLVRQRMADMMRAELNNYEGRFPNRALAGEAVDLRLRYGGAVGPGGDNSLGSFVGPNMPPAAMSEVAGLLGKIRDEMEKQTRMMEEERRKGGAPVANPGPPPQLRAGAPLQGGGVRN